MGDRNDSLRLLDGGLDASALDVDQSGTVASGESEQALLQAGKISVEEFIEMSIDRALAHLEGQLDEERLELMREVLRAQLEQDPHLSSLVAQSAAGG